MAADRYIDRYAIAHCFGLLSASISLEPFQLIFFT
jgi:hypothetical protein